MFIPTDDVYREGIAVFTKPLPGEIRLNDGRILYIHSFRPRIGPVSGHNLNDGVVHVEIDASFRLSDLLPFPDDLE